MVLRLDQIIQDARFGLRRLPRSPLVATVAILTLAIGIGLNAAVFSLVNAVSLRPLPYPHSERLVWIAPYSERTGQDTFASRGDYVVWKQHTQIFERMAAYGTQDLNLIVGGEASQERVASIGGDFWEITGARPRLGRLTAEEDEQGLILSYGLYDRRFGGLPTVIGQAVEISGASFTIVGVTYNIPVAVSGVGRRDGDSPPAVAVRMVSPAYLRAMGVSRLRGRWPSAADALDSVAVNETFARTVIANADPIGRTISSSFLSGTIVGVAHDFAYAQLDGEARLALILLLPFGRTSGQATWSTRG